MKAIEILTLAKKYEVEFFNPDPLDSFVEYTWAFSEDEATRMCKETRSKYTSDLAVKNIKIVNC